MTDSSEWCVHGDISTDHNFAIRIELSQLHQDTERVILMLFRC